MECAGARELRMAGVFKMQVRLPRLRRGESSAPGGRGRIICSYIALMTMVTIMMMGVSLNLGKIEGTKG